MKIALLLDAKGRQIDNPTPKDGTVNWTLEQGVATAWAEDGRTMLAELRSARPIWITHVGMRLEGFEAIDPSGSRFRAQQWQVLF